MSRGHVTSPQRTGLSALAALAVLVIAGCALTSKARPENVRWYTPEQLSPGPTTPSSENGAALRLAHVGSGIDLEQRIAHGEGSYRVDYYEERRWTELPEVYVRNALSRVLFEEGGFQRIVHGDGPTLDVQVLAFQEVNSPATHAARVALRIALSKGVALENTVEISEPVVGVRFEDVVAAMARALDRAAREVTRQVGVAMAKQAPSVQR